MPTATDALQAAADRLDAVQAAWYATIADVRRLLAQNGAVATTVITNFLNGGGKSYLVDPVLGNDTNTGLGPDTAFKSVDRAFQAIQDDGTTVFGANVFALGDVQVRQSRAIQSPVSIYGAEWVPDEVGNPYRLKQRQIRFLAEATNSPVSGFGRAVAGVRMGASLLRLQSLNIVLPDVIGAVNYRSIFPMYSGGSVICDNCTVTCETSTSLVNLFDAVAPASFFINGTIGTNAPGRLFRGVAAGANPNTSNFLFRTNLTSA